MVNWHLLAYTAWLIRLFVYNHNHAVTVIASDFIWDFGKLPFPTHLGKYFIKIGKIRAKIHETGKIKAIIRLGMSPIYGLKNGQKKSLIADIKHQNGWKP